MTLLDSDLIVVFAVARSLADPNKLILAGSLAHLSLGVIEYRSNQFSAESK